MTNSLRFDGERQLPIVQHPSSVIRPPSSPVELHIDELVLYGFPEGVGDHYQIAEAVERELVRLFGEQGVPPSIHQGNEVARVNGQSFEVAPGAKADSIGVQVAQAVYGGLAR